MKEVSLARRLLVWLRRMPHSRGFGVQSPSAYRFIRYVVSEHYPYYAYAEMRHAHPHMGWAERKMGELYFRLSNYCQAAELVSFGAQPGTLAEYVSRGCRRTAIAVVHGADGMVPPGVWRFVRIGEGSGAEAFLAEALRRVDSGTVLVVEGIGLSREARRLWHTLLGSKAVSVTFDLYYCGVAFFDTVRFKQNYIVNF